MAPSDQRHCCRQECNDDVFVDVQTLHDRAANHDDIAGGPRGVPPVPFLHVQSAPAAIQSVLLESQATQVFTFAQEESEPCDFVLFFGLFPCCSESRGKKRHFEGLSKAGRKRRAYSRQYLSAMRSFFD
jgi:hypothetical protein